MGIDRRTRAHFRRMLRAFSKSPAGPRGRWLFGLLILLLVTINGLNVVNSYVGRDFMTALARRLVSDFVIKAALYIGVFALSTVIEVFLRFTEETLALAWREGLTRWAVRRYLTPPVYHRLNRRMIANREVANPDERIADDVRTFTSTTLSFAILFLNGTFTVVAFSGVMWSISPTLFLVTVLYAGAGSYLTVAMGRKLIGLNVTQLDKEANFRSELIHVREHAEPVALTRWESHFLARLWRRIDDWATNMRRIIRINRNLGFFTTGYRYLLQIIPALVVAPLFFQGKVEFGVVSQSAMACAQLAGAFSLIITQFQSISSYAAVVTRLGALDAAVEQAQVGEVSPREVCEHGRPRSECQECQGHPVPASAISITTSGGEGGITYEHLTLVSPGDSHVLLRELSATISTGMRILVSGQNEQAKVALFRATAGFWETGEGRITHPPDDQLLFLAERTYLPPGTLREVLTRPGRESTIPDESITPTLKALDLEPLVNRVGGLDAEHRWESVFSLGEQQLLAFAHILLASPRFVYLNRAGTALKPGEFRRVLELLAQHSISVVTDGDTDPHAGYYHATLHLAEDGQWQWQAPD
jgi:putative ATP-binding cassette transporter